jgi:hypothetical protein
MQALRNRFLAGEQIMSGTTHHQDTYTGSAVMLSERQLAVRWDMSTRTLQRWRADKRGPAWHLLGKTVRYLLSDIAAFEEQSRQDGHLP